MSKSLKFTHFWQFLAGCLLIAGSVRSLAAADPAALPIPEAEETWQVIYLAGQRVGYARIFVQPVKEEGQTLVRTEAETFLTIQRFGQTLKMSTSLTTDETPAGDLAKFTFEMQNPPASSTTTVGVVDGGSLKVKTNINGRTTEAVAPWKQGIKSPAYQDRLLQQKPLAPGSQQEYEAFFPEMGKPGTLKVVAGDKETVPLLDEQSKTLQKLTVSNSLVPGVQTVVWVNEQGNSVKSSTAMLGTAMETYTVPKDVALRKLTVAELDLGVSTLVKTKQIPDPYATKKVVYRITIPNGDPAKEIPAGDSQQVKRISDHVAEVTVTALPLPTPGKIEKVDENYLKPSQFLQSDDPEVRKHADAATGPLTDPSAIAEAMEVYVQTHLTEKNFSTALASAGEVARSLEGDCTEHAVLLAAMLRAKGIPSRIAVGLVYVSGPSAFGGHMWTEANLNGKWIPLDATLGRGGASATHLKLGDSAFADSDGPPLGTFTSLINVIGKLQIDIVSIDGR